MKRLISGLVRLVYNLLFPVVFLFFLPALIYKLIKRPGWKATFMERFGVIVPERIKYLAQMKQPVWFHAVSVGETVIALDLIRAFMRQHPEIPVVLSTTTTTGQQLARDKAPEGVEVIYCPLDWFFWVRKTLKTVKPRLMVIFETEIWPELIWQCRDRQVPLALVNARMSDHSSKSYYRFRIFFGELLRNFAVIAAQAPADGERFSKVSPQAKVEVVGNLKFDQECPANLTGIDYADYFGAEPFKVLLAASTHPGEETLIVASFVELQKRFADLKLVLVPRHAERGTEVAEVLRKAGLSFARRSQCQKSAEPLSVLLADTTGEMLRLMAGADWVIMGKSLGGQNEGHNLLEPALLGKAIVSGAVLKNFRQILTVLKEADAVEIINDDAELTGKLEQLISNPERSATLGANARQAMAANRGATTKLVAILEKLC